MLEEYVSKYVTEAPPYSFGIGEKRRPLKPGVKTVYRLNKNENPYGVSPLAQKAMIYAVAESNRYGDPDVAPVVEKLAKHHDLLPENVLVTPGATSALGFLGEVFLQKDDEVILCSPTYPNYYNVIGKAGAKIVDVKLNDEFEPEFELILKAITSKTKLIFLCNPNNPTGTVCDDNMLFEFIEKVPKNIAIVVDEAYFEFIESKDYKSTISLISPDRNLIVVKTFSKIYGLAGARIGYLLSNKEIIDYLKVSSTGYFCSKTAYLGAKAALDDAAFVEKTIKCNEECRRYLTQNMKAFGFKVYPSSTNFIFFKPTIPAQELAEEMYTYGVQIRGDFGDYGRISVGTMEECVAAIESMQKTITKYTGPATK